MQQGQQDHSQVIHVAAAPALVAGRVAWVVAGALVCDHHHHRSVVIVAGALAVQELAIAICSTQAIQHYTRRM